MSHTERHTTLAWAEQLDTQRRATTRGTTWAELDAAIHANLTHAPGSLADCGTESLCDQAAAHCRCRWTPRCRRPHPPRRPQTTACPAPHAAAWPWPAPSALPSWFWPMGFAG
jgi:hypothetical protein